MGIDGKTFDEDLVLLSGILIDGSEELTIASEVSVTGAGEDSTIFDVTEDLPSSLE